MSLPSVHIPSPLNKGAPPPPDYAGAARQDTRTNRPNQNTPFGSSQWTEGPDGQWSQHTSFAGPLAGAASGLESQYAQANATPMDNGAQARQHAEDAIYGRATARLDPRFAQEQHDLTTSLANQGIDPNSAAYGKSLDNFGRTKNDAYSSALMDAIMGGGQEASRQQGMDLTSRMAPLQQLGGLRSLLQMPSFMGGGSQLQAANAQGNYGLEASQIDRQFWQDVMKGGSKVAGSMFGGGGG